MARRKQPADDERRLSREQYRRWATEQSKTNHTQLCYTERGPYCACWCHRYGTPPHASTALVAVLPEPGLDDAWPFPAGPHMMELLDLTESEATENRTKPGDVTGWWLCEDPACPAGFERADTFYPISEAKAHGKETGHRVRVKMPQWKGRWATTDDADEAPHDTPQAGV